MLGESVGELLATCPDPFAISLPMGCTVERRHLSEPVLNELNSEALSTGIVTQADLKRAKAR
jgi:hypothetical protein